MILVFASSSPRGTFNDDNGSPGPGLPIMSPGNSFLKNSNDSYSSSPSVGETSSPRSFSSDVGSPPLREMFRLDLNTPSNSPSTFSSPRATVFDPERHIRLRNEVIKEIMTTERDYVNDLHTIYEVGLN
jgi:hypothetical protein